MNFAPKTPAQIQKEAADGKPLPKGVYEFEIVESWDKTSQAGNDMIELKVSVMANGHGSRTLPDYLVAKRAAKLRNCAAACELLSEYETGMLCAADFEGKRGKLRLDIEKGKGAFKDRNIIEDYIPAP
jgi:hypothetical protein